MNFIDILCNVFHSSDFRKTNLTENSRGARGIYAHPGISTKWISESDLGELELGNHSLYLKCTMTAASPQAYKNESACGDPNPLLLEARKPAVRGDITGRGSGMWWAVSCIPSGWRFGSFPGCPPLSQPSFIPVYLTSPCPHLTSLLTHTPPNCAASGLGGREKARRMASTI